MAFDGFRAEVDSRVAEAREEAASGSGKFPPLPKGRYRGTIVPLKKDGSQLTEVADFGGEGANSKKKVLRIAIRIDDDSPTGAHRQVFGRIPMFSRYAPSQKNPQGAPARAYFDFWGKAIGRPDEELLSGSFQVGPKDLMGMPVTITLSEPKEPDKYNELGSNEISFYDAADPDYSKTPLRKPGAPVAPWLDAEDNLRPDYEATAKPTGVPAATGWAQASATKPADPAGTAPATTSPWAMAGAKSY